MNQGTNVSENGTNNKTRSENVLNENDMSERVRAIVIRVYYYEIESDGGIHSELYEEYKMGRL